MWQKTHAATTEYYRATWSTRRPETSSPGCPCSGLRLTHAGKKLGYGCWLFERRFELRLTCGPWLPQQRRPGRERLRELTPRSGAYGPEMAFQGFAERFGSLPVVLTQNQFLSRAPDASGPRLGRAPEAAANNRRVHRDGVGEPSRHGLAGGSGPQTGITGGAEPRLCSRAQPKDSAEIICADHEGILCLVRVALFPVAADEQGAEEEGAVRFQKSRGTP
jgi:hypothetical protein